MRKVILPTLIALLLNTSLVAQVTTTPQTQVNVPRVTAPSAPLTPSTSSTLLGRQFITDSLKAKKFTAAQTLRILQPVENSDSFQYTLSHDLAAMYITGFNSKELMEAVKSIYPRVSVPVAYKIFYIAFSMKKYGRDSNRYWAWQLKDTINTVYNSNTAYVQKNMRDAGENFVMTFRYYFHSVYVDTIPGPPYKAEDHLALYINAGYTPVEVADLFPLFFDVNSEPWLNIYTKGMKQANVSARDIAMALKGRRVDSNKITASLIAAGYPAADILTALR